MIDFNQPQIVAAVVGGAVAAVVTLVVTIISQVSQYLMHRKRLTFDSAQAERRATAELSLTERKFALDRELAAWKRRSELAEQALINFYEARHVFKWVRSRGIFGGEGKTRSAEEGESDDLKRRRDATFVPIERLTREKQVFSALQTLRPAFEAYFGPKGAEPFQEIVRTHAEITAIAQTLIQMASEGSRIGQSEVAMRAKLWGGLDQPDELDTRIEAAVQAMEAVCQPVLAWRPGA